MASASTRFSCRHGIFGYPSALPLNQLPTQEKVFKCLLWYRNLSREASCEIGSKRDIMKLVARL